MVSGTQNAFQSEWKRMDGLEELKITHWDQTEIYFSNENQVCCHTHCFTMSM